MAEDRLTSSDKRALLLWILLGIVGAVFAYKYFFRAFPEASVDFKVSRAEALARAQKFVGSLGEDVSGYQSAIVFDVDDNAKTYLEREVGLQQANQLMSSELNIWYWNVRFFRPKQEEEFLVRVSPAGEIVGYDHKVEEARAGPSLERAAAETAARNFLRSKMGLDLRTWDFLSEEANSSKKPNRLDWSFTWEKHGFRAKDAPYRLRVGVQGDRAGSSEEFLHVPEAWERSYAKLRSKNILYNQVAIIPYLALMLAAIGLGILLTIRKQTSWGGAIKLGVVVAILLTFMRLNNWPLDRMGYDTNSAYGSFVFEEIAKALLFGVVSALTISLILPGAEPLYRWSQPRKLRLGKAFTLRGLRSKEFFSAATVGLSLAAAHIGFIVAFYIVARHYGAWAPQDLNYENSVNTTFPWISGVAIGMLAATSEEFLFRLFAIPFLKRLTGSTMVAVIVPAFCWSFLHAAYPNEPPYIRGLEVGLIGIVAGIVMLRWGILATLIWHYTVDASLVGLLLVRSNSLYFKVSGVVVGLAALAPLIFAGVSYLSRGRFEPDDDLLNSAEPIGEISFESAPAETSTATATRRYDALTPAMMIFLAVCLVLGGAAAWRLKTPALGDYLKLSVDAKTAKARADEILRQHGLDPNSYRHATILADTTDPVTNEFLRQRVGIERLNEIYATEVPGVVWQVRYFRDSQPEEYSIKLKPDGSLAAFHHKLGEDAAGASLTKEEAAAKAEKYLREVKKLDLSQWTLVETYSDKRIHRTDHELAWQQRTPIDSGSTSSNDAVSHAFVRVKVAVLGDEVVDYRGAYYSKPEAREELEDKEGGAFWTFIKIPDEWRRKQEEQTLSRTIYSFAVPILLLGGLGVTGLVLFFNNLRSEAMRAIPWRRLVLWAVWGLVGYALVVGFGNRLQYFLNSYQTAIPFKTMMGGIVIGLLVGAVFYPGGLAALFGIASYFSNRAFGEERLPAGRPMPGVYYRDALWIGVCGTAGFLGLRRSLEFLSMHWQTVHRSLPFSLGQNFDAVFPAGAILGGALISSLFLTGVVGFVAAFVASVLRAGWLRFATFLLGAMYLTGSGWENGTDFAKQFLGQTILLGVIVFAVRRVVRFNMIGYLLVVALLTLLAAAAQLLGQPDAFYRANGYAVVLLMILVLAWPLAVWRMRAASGGGLGTDMAGSG
ncbi:MAG TPA: CPBP family intramembrane glutamic endopeptidase [Candidatus Binatus sp.]|nr:CPBP family intramembrane glutamic endopeptidase [Candidatus Binatus sp.]